MDCTPISVVVYFCDTDGSVPALDWLLELGRRDRCAVSKCIAQIDLLRQFGHELRRPIADFLRDGVYELRIRTGRSQHRVLYFYHGRNVIVLAHGLTKKGAVPPKEIDRVISRMEQFKKNPTLHTHRQETTNG